MTDVRDNLPAGVNNVDMDASGARRVPVANYGNPRDPTILDRIFKAWGVTGEHLIRGTGPIGQGVPPITNDFGPAYMLRFADGKWRYALFSGVNGPPWTYCPWEGWEAPTGRAAYLVMTLGSAVKAQEQLEFQLTVQAQRVEELRAELAAEMKQTEQRG